VIFMVPKGFPEWRRGAIFVAQLVLSLIQHFALGLLLIRE